MPKSDDDVPIFGSMLTGLAGGLMSGVSSVISNRQNIKAQKEAQDREYQYQRELNQQSQDFNLQNMELENKYAMENWLIQQEYNSPENQLKRIKETGINPNLVMGESGVTNAANTSPDTPNAQTPSAGDVSSYSVNLHDPFQILLDNATRALQTSIQQRASDAQIDNLAADTQSKYEDVLNKMEMRRGIIADNYKKETDNKYLRKMWKRELKLLDQEIQQGTNKLSLFSEEKRLLSNNADVAASTKNQLDADAAIKKRQMALTDANLAYQMWVNNYIAEYGVNPPKGAVQDFMNRAWKALKNGDFGYSVHSGGNSDPNDWTIPPLTEVPTRHRIRR